MSFCSMYCKLRLVSTASPASFNENNEFVKGPQFRMAHKTQLEGFTKICTSRMFVSKAVSILAAACVLYKSKSLLSAIVLEHQGVGATGAAAAAVVVVITAADRNGGPIANAHNHRHVATGRSGFLLVVGILLAITTLGVQVTLQIAVDIGGIAAHLAAEVAWWQAALVLQMTLKTVLPLVGAIAVAAHPRLLNIRIVDHIGGVLQRLLACALILDQDAITIVVRVRPVQIEILSLHGQSQLVAHQRAIVRG